VLSGYIPAPMLFGVLIDSTCRLWETDGGGSSKCAGGTGSCLLFDTDQLRWRTYGVALGVQLIQLIFAVLLYFTIRHRKFDSGDELPSKSLPPVSDVDAKSPTTEEMNLIEVNSSHPSDDRADSASR